MKPTYIPVFELSTLRDENIITDEQFDFLCESDTFSFGDNDKTLISIQRVIDELKDGDYEDISSELYDLITDDNGNMVYVDVEA